MSVVTVTLINVRNVGLFGCESSESVNIGVLKGKIKEMKMRNKQRKYEITYLHALEIGPTYHLLPTLIMTVLSHQEGSRFLRDSSASREIYRNRYNWKYKLYWGGKHLDFGEFGLPVGMDILEVG